MRFKRKLRQGDEINVCGRKYKLVERFGGGFQFRTWLVKESGRMKRAREYVIKITTKPSLATSELKLYIFLARKDFPDRYYSELLAFDNEAVAYREGRRIGKFYAILLKKYDGSLESLLNGLNPVQKKIVKDKLKRRVEKLHSLNVVHGDLRKANILLRIRKGIGVLLTDFANSKIVDDKRKPENKELIDEENRKLETMLSHLS